MVLSLVSGMEQVSSSFLHHAAGATEGSDDCSRIKDNPFQISIQIDSEVFTRVLTAVLIMFQREPCIPTSTEVVDKYSFLNKELQLHLNYQP